MPNKRPSTSRKEHSHACLLRATSNQNSYQEVRAVRRCFSFVGTGICSRLAGLPVREKAKGEEIPVRSAGIKDGFCRIYLCVHV